MNKIKVTAHYINQRIDNYLFRELKDAPKSLIYRLIRKGAIKVNRKKTKPDYKLLLDDEISLPDIKNAVRPKDTQHKMTLKPELISELKNRVIYDCKDFMIINKPAGMAVHAGSNIRTGLIDILRQIYGKSHHIELVHRLDRDTSGCLLIAKNRLALNDLHSAMRDGDIQKTYIALVDGLWTNSKRLIQHPLRKSVLQGGERMVVVDPVMGKPSTTRVEVKAANKNTSLLELTAVTGRTHQLRVHMAHEKHPILGDSKYGYKEQNKDLKSKTGLGRIFLHAYKLEFNWGAGKNKVSVTAPFDDDLEKVLKYFEYI